MEYRRLSHSVYHCQYHIVLPTKYRRKIFNDGLLAHITIKLKEVQKHYPRITIDEINHDKDHIHMLVNVPPNMTVGSAVRIIKANTSRGIKEKFPFLKDVYWGTDGIWSDGYFASTVGLNEKTIRQYIEHQGQEDDGQAKLVLG